MLADAYLRLQQEGVGVGELLWEGVRWRLDGEVAVGGK